MDEVFRALADPTRRSLLDELYSEDGQTLGALESRLPMTRFGVMKHLRVLDWSPGSAYRGVHPAAPGPLMEGENLEVGPPRRLVQSFTALWSEGVKAEGTSRVAWEIEPVGDSCRLLVIHDKMREDAHPEI